MWGIDIKQKIENAVMMTAADYMKDNELSHMFSDPIIGYAQANDPLFLTFSEKNWTLHPKEIYRPGNTVVVHFLPFSAEIVESNRNNMEISKEWTAAYEAAIFFSALLNSSIKDTLESLGRLASLTSLPGDWNEKRNAPDWSHKLAAYVAGMGEFGIAGSFITSVGSAGRLGSIITELKIEPSKVWPKRNDHDLESIANDIQKSYLFLNRNNDPIKDEKIFKCPAKAISSEGVDLAKCRDFCAAQKQIVPSPDVCGKCYD